MMVGFYMRKEKILILGANGMLGHVLYKELSNNTNYSVFGTVRSKQAISRFYSKEELNCIIDGINAYDFQNIQRAIDSTEPTIIINCIGLIKQKLKSNDYISSIFINSLLPHKIIQYIRTCNIRFIHFSTDCVFNGRAGFYKEESISNAEDIYGRTKYLGEISFKNSLTLRTSIIGHELHTKTGLLEWFLSQSDKIHGYKRAVFNGFPTIEIANIIGKIIIPKKGLEGLYHVASKPINKFDLLKLISFYYNKDILIKLDDKVIIDRSLNSERFYSETGYKPPDWEILIQRMHEHYSKNKNCYSMNI
jgi:dTDP-4-dehydrorhamnose reductase